VPGDTAGKSCAMPGGRPPRRLDVLLVAPLLVVVAVACDPHDDPAQPAALAPLDTVGTMGTAGTAGAGRALSRPAPSDDDRVAPADAFAAARETAQATLMTLARAGDCAGLAAEEQFWRQRTSVVSQDVAAMAAALADQAVDIRRYIGCPPSG
jgi:hypothetical protein